MSDTPTNPKPPESPEPLEPIRLAVMISGGGRTLQNIAELIEQGELNAVVPIVISSRENVFGLERAKNLNISSVVVPRKQYERPSEFSDVIWEHVRKAGANYVCLAGFLSLLAIPDDFINRVVNIHPGLLPSFGGQGMFGHHVHEAVLKAGCKVSGCTVHFCDQTYDTGPIILQRTCPVLEDDTPDTLAARVFEEELIAMPDAIKLIADGRVNVRDGRTFIAAG